MASFALTAEAKAHMRANLELELNTRRDKLISIRDAQVASLRSRLERRINRVPAHLRRVPIVELLNAASAPTSKATASIRNVQNQPAAARQPRAATVTAASKDAQSSTARPVRKATGANKPHTNPKKPAARKEPPKPAPKTTRGAKRTSEEANNDDKENELAVPKKRSRPAAVAPKSTTKSAPIKPKSAPPPRATRATSKTTAQQVLSPKPNNARSTQGRTRRAR